jgi:cytosine/adenosine deaminase-related metal-dependent hydrolase
MRCFQTDIVFTVSGPPIEQGVVICDEEGRIVETGAADILQRYPELKVEKLDGALCPGFINTHCHLELSAMKGQVRQGTKMLGFISEFLSKRGTFNREQILEAIRKGEEEMIENGIVAVGDISNTNETFAQKAKGNLYYHTFLEAFDLHPSRATETFLQIRKLRDELVQTIPDGLTKSSIVPHAPYTVSPELHEKISAYAHQHGSLLSIHNQESDAEEELFRQGTGPFVAMYAGMKLDHTWFKVPGRSSLHSTLSYYHRNKKLLLVHNTRSTAADMQLDSGNLQLFWATCPRANLYIEQQLPDYPAMVAAKLKVTIGTDSLASNSCLSVLEEMKTIASACSSIETDTLLKWACIHGAECLGIEKEYGSLDKGKKPGLVLISAIKDGKLTAGSKARRIL